MSTPHTTLVRAAQGDSNPSNGSEALFSMYLDRVIEGDRRMVESWKGDADGMLVFVSCHATSHTPACNLEIVGRSLLCRGRSIARGVYPGY